MFDFKELWCEIGTCFHVDNMENFLNDISEENVEFVSMVRTVQDVSQEMLKKYPRLFKKFLEIYSKQYDLHAADREAVAVNDSSSQTVENVDEQSNAWDINNIANDVALVASKNLEEAGFIYDHNSGLYYDHKAQCHYNPETKLYYYHQTGSYFYYDESSGSLQFYSSAQKGPCNGDDMQEQPDHNEQHTAVVDSYENVTVSEACLEVARKVDRHLSIDEEKEDGECSDSDDSIVATSTTPAVIEKGPMPFDPDESEHVAPCIRILVRSTALNRLRAGTVFIVTRTGGTLGREGDHDVLIPDELVSKVHSSFQYVFKNGSFVYEIIDMGSKNGTYLNGSRLSDSLVQSEPFEITHGSIISVGGTDLLCHIHSANDTCEECQGYIQLDDPQADDNMTSLSLKEKHQREAKAIKKKFGLIRDKPTKYPEGYGDRSELRRKTVGSSHSSEKTESSSVDWALDKRNKGFGMLAKMGWTEGSSLGKTPDGQTEPINVIAKTGKEGIGYQV